MEPSAFDQLLRLGDELQTDYAHMFDAGDHMMMPFEGPMDGDSLSLLLSDLDAPCSTSSSSYSGQASQSSSSSSPAASMAAEGASCFPYKDMMSDASPALLDSPPLHHHHQEHILPMGGGDVMMMHGGAHYEDYASPAGTYASSDDSGHHSPATSSGSTMTTSPYYDIEAGGWQEQLPLPLQRRSSSEDSCSELAAAGAARRALRLQPQTQPQRPRVVYVLPPQQQQQQQPPAAAPKAYKVPPTPSPPQPAPPKVMTSRPLQLQPVATLQSAVLPRSAAPPPKTTVLLARTAPACVQFVSSNGAALRAVKVEPKEEIEEEDLQYFRKQEDRKQKNRAAAQQSRLRRRGELDELRTRVVELSTRNQELEEENGRLKRRVHELESQFHWSPPRKRVAVAGAAATTCLMVFVMMFAFQTTPLDRSLSPFSLPIPVSRQIGEGAHSRVVRDVRAEVAPASRALLAVQDYDESSEEKKKESAEMAEYAAKLARSRNATTGTEMGGGAEKREGCTEKQGKRYPNQTETIRLNTELNNWVESHDLVEWASGLQGGRRMFTLNSGLGNKRRRLVPDEKEEQRPVSGTVSSFNATLSPVHAPPTNTTTTAGEEQGKKQSKKKSPRGEAKREAAKERAMRDRAWKHLDMVSPGLREHHGPENRPDWSTKEHSERINRRLVGGIGDKEREWHEAYERLAAAVQQRTDTLYVVAMKDYLLLPAMERNATSRPRVSLILPAVMNGTMTTANNQVMLMRLDLDVVGTGLIYLAEGLLPIFHNLSIY